MKIQYLLLLFISGFIILLSYSCKDNGTNEPTLQENWEARLDFVRGEDSTYLSTPLDAIDSLPITSAARVVVSFRESFPAVGRISVEIRTPNTILIYSQSLNPPDTMKRNTINRVEFASLRTNLRDTLTGSVILTIDSTQRVLHKRNLVRFIP